MDELEPLWVRPEPDPSEAGPSNPYVDLIEGKKPPEIIEFEMNMSPYAKMPPNMTSLYSAPRGKPRTPKRLSFLAATISLVVLVAVVLVFAHHVASQFAG